MFTFKDGFSAIAGQPRVVGSASTNTSITWTGGGTTKPALANTVTPVLGTTYSNMEPGTGPTYYTSPATPNISNWGTGDFTYEAWIYFHTVPSSAREFLDGEGSGASGLRIGQQYTSSNVNSLSLYARSGADQNYCTLPAWVTGVWYFIAAQRSAANNKISFWVGKQGDGVAKFYNGDSVASSTAVGYNYATPTSNLIGGYAGTSLTTGLYVNEVCYSNVARYPRYGQNIRMPTAFFTVDQYTKQLITFQGTVGANNITNVTS